MVTMMNRAIFTWLLVAKLPMNRFVLIPVDEGISVNERSQYSRKSLGSFAGNTSLFRSTGIHKIVQELVPVIPNRDNIIF